MLFCGWDGLMPTVESRWCHLVAKPVKSKESGNYLQWD